MASIHNAGADGTAAAQVLAITASPPPAASAGSPSARVGLEREQGAPGLPDALSMEFEMVDIEAPPPPVVSDDEWDEDEDDGWLLHCFTLSTSFCAGFHTAFQRRLLMCGIYLRDRRFWVCKVIILIMDMAILRGAISMGEEYCAQDDEVSEFGWIIWSSFLVFCKFVYLRPVFHLHQLGVFHSSRRDALKSASLEFMSMVCHVLMLIALLWRTAEPGFSAYRTASCHSRGRAIVPNIAQCARAADWYSLSSKYPLQGENRSRLLSLQPPGCYYSSSEEQLYYNPLICSEDEQWCRDWVARTYGSCTKESSCLCVCSLMSMAVLVSVIIFSLPMPLQWRMFHSSIIKVAVRARTDADAPVDTSSPSAAPNELEEQGDADSDAGSSSSLVAAPSRSGGGRREASRGEVEMVDMRSRGRRGRVGSGRAEQSDAGRGEDWRDGKCKYVSVRAYGCALKGLQVQELEGLSGRSVYADAEKGLADSAGAARKRIIRLQRELRSLPSQLDQHPNSTMWVRYDADRPQFMRAAITGPAGTPYESGVFVFDLFFPLDYPQVPPKVTFLTTGHGTVRFNPNLYADGKVCLSLLGTYEGPRWTPGGSLHQVLVSIQGMILGVSHPIYNEPGLGGFEHHEAGGGGHTWHVHKMAERCYDERVQVATIQYAMLAHLKPDSLPQGFEESVRRHFALKRGAIMYRLRQWMREASEYRARHGANGLNADHVSNLKKLLPRLEDALGALAQPPPPEEDPAGVEEDAGEAAAAAAEDAGDASGSGLVGVGRGSGSGARSSMAAGHVDTVLGEVAGAARGHADAGARSALRAHIELNAHIERLDAAAEREGASCNRSEVGEAQVAADQHDLDLEAGCDPNAERKGNGARSDADLERSRHSQPSGACSPPGAGAHWEQDAADPGAAHALLSAGLSREDAKGLKTAAVGAPNGAWPGGARVVGRAKGSTRASNAGGETGVEDKEEEIVEGDDVRLLPIP